VKTAFEEDLDKFQRFKERAELLTKKVVGLSLPLHPTPYTLHPAPTGLGEYFQIKYSPIH